MGTTLYLMSSDCYAKKDAVIPSLVSALVEHGKTLVFQPIVGSAPLNMPAGVEQYSVYSKEESITLGVENDTMQFYAKIQKELKEKATKYDVIICDGVQLDTTLPVFAEKISTELPLVFSMPIVQVQCLAGFSFQEMQIALFSRNSYLKEKAITPLYTIAYGGKISDAEKNTIEARWKEEGLGKLALLGSADIPKDITNALWIELQQYSDIQINSIGLEMKFQERACSNIQRIVLPEGLDVRVIEAGSHIHKYGIAKVILLGKKERILATAEKIGSSLEGIEIIDPEYSFQYEGYVQAYIEARKHKGITEDRAREVMKNPSYFGTMMVQQGDADGMVSGAVNTTADTIRPSLEFIKTKEGVSVVSSSFLLCIKNESVIFADCAVNPNPNAQQLAEIAISSAETAKTFGIIPKVAMLSYATANSAQGPDVDLVREATAIVKERMPNLPIDGPVQFDAAVEKTVAQLKLPDSAVKGEANVFIFPNLCAGNIGYKAVQRSANASAYGPFLQGLRKPVNDLSRGCSVNDIIVTVAVTAIQAQKK